MLNTSAPLYEDNKFEKEIKKQEAELYARLYPIAAEDFVAHPDMKVFVSGTVSCLQSIQKQLTSLFKIISHHTHVIPPHVHNIAPHTHTSTAPGYPTGPNIGAFATLPTPLTTNPPSESGTIIWTDTPNPQFNNTTGATPNMEGNRVIVGTSSVGPLISGKRRMKVDPVLNSVTVLPIVEGLKLL